jgi:glutathione S-transferase
MASAAYRLVIGNKRYSSWSLRPWLMLRHSGIAFTETMVALRKTTTSPEILNYSPAGLVPILQHGDLAIWDSLAIAEYLNERHPEAKLWPADTAARARARCVSAEMHSGFREVRITMSMDFSATGLTPEFTDGARRDIARIVTIWREARTDHATGGPFLFGTFSIADAMYAPVASRFTSYGIRLADYGDDGKAEAYRTMMMALPAMLEWGKAAAAEAPFEKD